MKLKKLAGKLLAAVAPVVVTIAAHEARKVVEKKLGEDGLRELLGKPHRNRE